MALVLIEIARCISEPPTRTLCSTPVYIFKYIYIHLQHRIFCIIQAYCVDTILCRCINDVCLSLIVSCDAYSSFYSKFDARCESLHFRGWDRMAADRPQCASAIGDT